MRARQRPKRTARIRDRAAMARHGFLPGTLSGCAMGNFTTTTGLCYGRVPTATLNDTSVATPVHFTADEIPERTGVRPVNRCLTFALSAADPLCQV